MTMLQLFVIMNNRRMIGFLRVNCIYLLHLLTGSDPTGPMDGPRPCPTLL